MAGRKKDRGRRHADERAARAARTANANARRAAEEATRPAPPPAPPRPESTEASRALVEALTAGGHTDLARRAAALEFDENYGEDAFPLLVLIRALNRAGAVDLIDRATKGDFDATDADNTAWYATPAGMAETAEFEQVMQDPETKALADKFADTINRADPRTLDRIGKEGVAKVIAEDDPTPPVDDAAPVREDEVIPPLWEAMNGHQTRGEALDTPEVYAAAEVAFLTGGAFNVGCVRDDGPVEQAGWYCFATYAVPGADAVNKGVVEQPGVNAAAAGFAREVLTGSQCKACGRVVTTDPAGVMAADATMADGSTWTASEQQAAGMCLWRRVRTHWVRGCA